MWLQLLRDTKTPLKRDSESATKARQAGNQIPPKSATGPTLERISMGPPSIAPGGDFFVQAMAWYLVCSIALDRVDN